MAAQSPQKKPGMPLPTIGHVDGFAMFVDINGFSGMVEASATANDSIAQFTRDVLAGAIHAIESVGGEAVAFMGDAILGILPNGKAAVEACYLVAKEVDDVCEWVWNHQKHCDDVWEFAPGGPSVKVALEYGRLDVSTISCRLLGEHRLFVGDAINYAARISKAGIGNRCILGPQAASMEFASYPLTGPYQVDGKPGESPYTYFKFSMDDVWVEDQRIPGEDTYRD